MFVGGLDSAFESNGLLQPEPKFNVNNTVPEVSSIFASPAVFFLHPAKVISFVVPKI